MKEMERTSQVLDALDEIDQFLQQEAAPSQAVLAEEFSSLSADCGDGETREDQDRRGWPEWLVELGELYRASRSHVFLLYGNVNDYPDNTGLRGDINMVLFDRYDEFWVASRALQESRRTGRRPNVVVSDGSRPRRLAAVYTVNQGLVFATERSRQEFRQFMQRCRPDIGDDAFAGQTLNEVLWLLEQYFQASGRLFLENYEIRAGRKQGQLAPEIALTVIFQNAEYLFPAGDLATLQSDRTAIATIANWARSGSVGSRNKIILVAPHLSGIHEALRSGDSRISAIRVKRPDAAERLEWMKNFSDHIAAHPVILMNRKWDRLLLDDEMSLELMANSTAGMSRQQIEGIFMESWLTGQPVDQVLISRHKQKANEAEFGEIVTIKQPQGSFDLVGGHELLKEYFHDFVLRPLWTGDRKRVTSGVLLSGPPGTGKTFLAECLAAMAKFNFVEADFSRLFGSLVGETERKTDQFLSAIEALAPCIVFCDELDSVFSAGRQSPGDSGVQARMFNKVMKWLSSPARIGQVVVIAATNRPDLLDAAFIRAGRFDDILPCLPPGPGDARGRAAILNAVRKKLGIRLSRELGDTVRTPDAGLGRLLHDRRIWTGAEIERLLKLAHSYACRRAERAALEQSRKDGLDRKQTIEVLREASRSAIVLAEDWERAIRSYLPSSRDVEFQIDLALRFCNNLDFCPPEWRPRLMELRDAPQESHGYLDHGVIERD